ncbi:MAG: hypothetical protein RBU30_18240 [Polyangia bacterium]|jgi:hypothetical protein|nr:hypothetical protein [Polyangia bacterium]
MAFMDSLQRWARLAGLLGLAAGSLVVQACTRDSPGVRDAAIDAAQQPDAAGDAAAGDAAAGDATVSQDASAPQDAETLDARLWDVICE